MLVVMLCNTGVLLTVMVCVAEELRVPHVPVLPESFTLVVRLILPEAVGVKEMAFVVLSQLFKSEILPETVSVLVDESFKTIFTPDVSK